ncbi:MAG: glycosyltransferase family 39 protein [Verrucomicrobia bacterium]|nr:glycosyltransferase family 39 protein [Verrucomicrobiota bacterium]
MPVAILALQSALIAVLAVTQSVTFDETGHLAAGLAHWKHGDFSLYAVNPPLSRLVATLPALPLAANFEFPAYNALPERREELRLGVLFSTQNEFYQYFSVVARLTLLPFCWLGGFVCYAWAKDLYGFKAGLLALLLWCFSPNIQANASQVLPDLAVSSLFVTSCFLLRKQSKGNVNDAPVVAGLVLGAALLCKFTAVLLVPVVVAVFCWRVARLDGKSVHFRMVRGIGKAVTICSVSLLVIKRARSDNRLPTT